MADNTSSDEKDTVPTVDKNVSFSRPKQERGSILSDGGQSDSLTKHHTVLLVFESI